MKATETRLVDFLRKSNQFLIPIFQRPYSWNEKQCRQLWDDIVRVATKPNAYGHFVGSIVYVEQGLYSATQLPRLLVIDGQQRLTTALLLIDALGRHAEISGAGELTRMKLQSRYLFNQAEDGELRYKLLLSRRDKATLCKLLDDQPAPEKVAERVHSNHHLFQKWITESGLQPHQVHDGLARLLVVDIALDRHSDNAQMIFESLNSTGLDLSQSDLIRNHVLLGLEPGEQSRLYEAYWEPIERIFQAERREPYFDRFMRDYLTIKTGELPAVRAVYEEFKRYHLSGAGGSVEEIVADVHRYAGHYAQVAFGTAEDAEVRRRFRDMHGLKMDVANPFLLQVLEDHRQGRVDRVGLLEVLNTIESYLFRRAICEVPANILNKAFALLLQGIDRNCYTESIAAYLLLRDGRAYFPADAEFEQKLRTKDLYNFRLREYCLRKLENHGRKEPVRLEDYTIEHVLPQNKKLSTEWQQSLGPAWQEVQARWLHTLGNLTLTGYNSELSDRPFNEKKAMAGGFADSPIRLNRELGRMSTWNEQEIENRGRQLATRALEIWPMPQLTPEQLAAHKPATPVPLPGTAPTVSQVRKLNGGTLELYTRLRDELVTARPDVLECLFPTMVGFGLKQKKRPYFALLHPQLERLRIRLRLPFSAIPNPPDFCRDFVRPGIKEQRTLMLLRSQDQVSEAVRICERAIDHALDPSLDMPAAPESPLEAEFADSLRKVLAACKPLGYRPVRFMQMIKRRGAVGTVKQLLRPGLPQDGVQKLKDLGKSELTVEFLAQQPKFRDLFTEDEVRIAGERLGQLP